MIQSKLLALIFLSFSSIRPSEHNQSSSVPYSTQPCHIHNATFKDAEELRYKVYYNWGVVWLNAAEVVFKITETANTYKIYANGKTISSYEWLYKVNDTYECEVDKKTMLPLWSTRRIQENNYRLYEKLIFNQNGETVTSIKGKNEKETESKVIKVSDCSHDILSILYFVRNYEFHKFKSGQKFPVKVFLDRTTNHITAKYDGSIKKKDIKGLGKFKAHSISPSTIEGKVFNDDSQIHMFISHDKNQIPLLIESDLSFGSIKAVLKSTKNLRYNLDSKVE